MFNPIGNFAASQPLTLVATALPNAVASLRVPYDNVSPSVSSPEINNNARGNRASLPKPSVTQNIPVSTSNDEAPVASNDNAAKYSSSSQTAFLAQLAAGEFSPEVSGIFLQYEKLLSYANVKYKPSNAGKPVDPIGIFKTLLQIEKESPDEIVIDTPNPIVTETPVAIEDFVAQIRVEQKPEALPQSQIFKYLETTARNNNPEPAQVEVA